MKISNSTSHLFEETDTDSRPVPIHSLLSPGEKIDRTLSILKGKLGEAFEGRVKSGIYVQSVDCGGGKSSAAQEAIAAWKVRGFLGRGGIIVAVGTLTEIDAYIAGCNLDVTDYAVITSDPRYNGFGLGRHQAAQAKVLFTTHEQLRRRLLEKGSFAAADTLYFMFAPRRAIIWDEGLVPALPASFDLDDLEALPSALKHRGYSKAKRDAFKALVPGESAQTIGSVITVPLVTSQLAGKITLQRKLGANHPAKQTLDAISKLGGAKGYLAPGKEGDWTVIGRGLPLPNDLPPTFVLDASARLTGNYDHLHRYGFNVVYMDPALVSYANLDIRWWDKGCGMTTLASTADRAKIINVVATLVNEQPDQQWMIVHRKAFGKEAADGSMLPDDLKAKLSKPDNVRSLTWGRHLGSNAFRDIGNVIVLGSYNYNDAAYEAQHLAMSGNTDGAVTKEQRREREDAEFMHNLYQAVCRSRVRQHVDGVCRSVTAYLIMKHSDHRQGLVERAFTGCSISMWQPVEPKRTNKFDLITTTMTGMFANRTIITKAALIEACGGSGKSYLDKIFRGENFKKFAAAQGIAVKGVNIYKMGLSKAA